MAGMHAIIVANLMSKATAPRMGRPVINARVLIISKPFVIQHTAAKTAPSPFRGKKSQPPQRHGFTGSSNGGHGKGGGKCQHQKKKTPKKPLKQKAYEVTFQNSGPIRSNNYIW